MATCPKCGEFLSDTHDCTGQRRAVAAAVALALTSAVLGIVALTRLVQQPTHRLVAVTGLLGGLTFAFGWGLARANHRRTKPRWELSALRETSSFQPSPSAGSSQAGGAVLEVERAGSGSQASSGAASILVVDDEAPVRALLTRWLEPLGYAVRQAANASQAMAAMSADPASIMLCDVKMPGQNGLWLAERVHEHWPQTAIIMATSADDLETVITSRKIGAVGYVTKPFGRELLLQALRKANPTLDA